MGAVGIIWLILTPAIFAAFGPLAPFISGGGFLIIILKMVNDDKR